MPISSTQVANILQGQIGMFSASAQYAQAVSAQYGFQPSSASPVDDPRDSSALQGGMAASAGIRGAELAGSIGSTAAMFGMAPRALDPFTMSAHAASMGYATQGVAGAVGAGAAVGGAYLALGSVFKWGVDQAVFGAQQHAMLSQQIGSMAPGMGSGQIGQMSSMVSQAARSGMGSVNELTALMQQGGADGSVSMQSLSQFQMSFQKLLGNVRAVSVALNSNLMEAQQAMQQVRSMGIGPDAAPGFLASMRGIGQSSGLSPQQMMQSAQMGAQMGRQTGIGMQSGAMGGMVQAGVIGMVERNGLINGVDQQAGGQFQNAAFRFLGSQYGRPVLAAMMNRNGEYDADAAAQIATGSLSRQQIREMASRNLSGSGQLDRFNARRGELMGQFVSDFGGQAISPALNEMTRGSGQPETLRAGLTGLTRSDMHGMEQLNRAMPGLRSRMAQEGRAAFEQGTGSSGLFDAIGQNVEQIIAPYRDMLQRYGADLAQSAQGVIEDVTKSFVRKPPGRADPSVYARYFSQHLAGGGNSVTANVQAGMGGVSPSGGLGGGGGPYDGLFGGLPSGLRIGAMGPGTGLSELPMFGMAPMGHNGWAGAAALGSLPWTGGRNALGALGAGVDSMGAGMMTAFGAESSGFMGMGGIGTLSGTGRFAGAAMRGIGMLGRGAGALAGALAVPALAADLAFNELPEIQRGLGRRAITQGAILGQGADFINFASQTGQLANPLEEHRIGSWSGGMDYEDMQRKGLVPVGGMTGPGNQMFASTQTMRQANELLANSNSSLAGLSRYGDMGKTALTLAGLSGRSPTGQAAYMADQLGIPAKDAAKMLLAMRGAGLDPTSTQDPADYRKQWLTNNRLGDRISQDPNSGHVTIRNLMMKGMDPKNGVLGGKTIDAVMQELDDQHIPRTDPAWTARVGAALQALSVGTPEAAAAAGTLDFADMAQKIARGDVKPSYGGRSNDWMDPARQSDASNWMRMAGDVKPVLEAQRGEAHQNAWTAAVMGGYSSSRMSEYVDSFSQGPLTADDGRGHHAGQDMRAIAPEEMNRGMLADKRMSSRDFSRMAGRLAMGGDAASQRLSMYAGEDARLRSLTERGRSATQIITALTGADFSGRVGVKASEHFKKGTGWSADIESRIVAGVHDLVQLQAGVGNKLDPNVVEGLSREIDQAGQRYAKTHDKHAFDEVTTKLATFRAQAPGNMSRDGDFAKRMAEVTTGLTQFGTALNTILQNKDFRKMGGLEGAP